MRPWAGGAAWRLSGTVQNSMHVRVWVGRAVAHSACHCCVVEQMQAGMGHVSTRERRDGFGPCHLHIQTQKNNVCMCEAARERVASGAEA